MAGSHHFCDKNSCKRGVKDCDEARFRLIKSRMCLATRENVRDICHAGIDDPGHQAAVDGAMGAINRCERKVSELCDCNDTVKGPLLESARRLCDDAPDCSTIYDCASTLAALKVLQFCRFALNNIALRCQGEAPPFDVVRVEGQEASCRAALSRRCAQATP